MGGGVIAIAGLGLGIFEAIGLIIVVGLAVDYSVHICHSYNETRFIQGEAATRFLKTQHALTEMGISVVSGAATTFLASLFLVAATFAFYYVFGIFMLMTVIFSLLVSLTIPALHPGPRRRSWRLRVLAEGGRPNRLEVALL